MNKKETFAVFFRTSKRFGKNPIPGANCYLTHQSLLKSFSLEEIIVIADNATIEQQKYFMKTSKICYITKRGNCGSFLLQIKLALEKHYADIYYFVEDDHLHLPDQKKWLQAGLEYFNFVSLYDHPDKYTFKEYQNLYRKVVKTTACHFTSTPSTVMTFAMRRKTLLLCANFFLECEYTKPNLKIPQDHLMFLDLAKQGYSLGTCIPGVSTHCELNGLSPYVNWEKYIELLKLEKAEKLASEISNYPLLPSRPSF
jgi:hypothetical protein